MRKNKTIQALEEKVQALSMLVTRASLMSKLGKQYGGDREIYKALGYPSTEITFSDYYAKYLRQDIAKAIIDRPVKATWQGSIELIETNDEKRTTFEKDWINLFRDFGLKSVLSRVDRLAGIGKYGVLLLGFDDTPTIEDFSKPVKSGKRKLFYIKPFSEESAKINSYVSDNKDKRYGLPEFYDIVTTDPASNNTRTVKVHHSRVIHVVEDVLESEVEGIPKLQAVYNRLMDLEKLVGGDAEMFWRGARPGYQGKILPNYQMTSKTEQDLKDQIDEYENNLRRILVNEGLELESLAQQIADPANHVNIQIQMISAVTGIPQRILLGSERGELASSEDRGEWMMFIQARREDHVEPHILRPLVDKLIKHGVLPEPSDGYTIKWDDLYSMSEKARVDIGKARATALREYTLNPMAEAIIPPSTFMQFFLGLTSDQIELINKMRDAEIAEEELTQAIVDRMKGQATNPDGKVQKELDRSMVR